MPSQIRFPKDATESSLAHIVAFAFITFWGHFSKQTILYFLLHTILKCASLDTLTLNGINYHHAKIHSRLPFCFISKCYIVTMTCNRKTKCLFRSGMRTKMMLCVSSY